MSPSTIFPFLVTTIITLCTFFGMKVIPKIDQNAWLSNAGLDFKQKLGKNSIGPNKSHSRFTAIHIFMLEF